MAGQPMKRSLFTGIEEMAKLASLDEGREITGPEFVYEWIVGGGTLSSLAEDLQINRGFVSRKLNADAAYRKALEDGRRDAAFTMADESMEIAENMGRTDTTMVQVAAGREQIKVRQWLAGVYNADRFAPKGNNVTINIGDMHLDALRKVRDVTPATITIEGDSDE